MKEYYKKTQGEIERFFTDESDFLKYYRSGKTDLDRGTIKILDTCKEAELPEPEMQELDGGFNITLFKNVLTEEQLKKLGLNARQIKAVLFVKEKGIISNKEYQEVFGVARMTATRDLTLLVEKGVLKSSDTKGAGSYYEL